MGCGSNGALLLVALVWIVQALVFGPGRRTAGSGRTASQKKKLKCPWRARSPQ